MLNFIMNVLGIGIGLVLGIMVINWWENRK